MYSAFLKPSKWYKFKSKSHVSSDLDVRLSIKYFHGVSLAASCWFHSPEALMRQ